MSVEQTRSSFELTVEKNGTASAWTAYAQWEASQKEFMRAKAVWERAVALNPDTPALWLGYAELATQTLRYHFARGLFDRAIRSLPGNNSDIWLAYVAMEEELGNELDARRVYEQWTRSDIDVPGWLAYASFEVRVEELERARAVLERMVTCHATVEALSALAAFDEEHGDQRD